MYVHDGVVVSRAFGDAYGHRVHLCYAPCGGKVLSTDRMLILKKCTTN